MFYRRKVILALLEALGGELNRTDFQKHLFLFTQNQEDPAYDFVPYHYGAFSFGVDADRAPMVRSGLLGEGDTWKKKTKTSYLRTLSPEDQKCIARHREQYRHLKGRDLLRKTYIAYPYYAIHSKVAEEVLSRRELERVNAAYPSASESILFTIGYEGRSLEAYLNGLIKNQVRVLYDVRKNPVSRKFGFSKRRLQKSVDNFGVQYIHIPELGIASGKRKAADSADAYARLFEQYEQETLPKCAEILSDINVLMDERHRVALTCFEACHTDCHRSRVADALTRLPGWNYPVSHI